MLIGENGIYPPDVKNRSPMKMCHPNGKVVFQPSFFRGFIFTSGVVFFFLWGRVQDVIEDDSVLEVVCSS